MAVRKSRAKTARAIEPNAGTRQALEKKLKALFKAFNSYAANQLIADMADEGLLETPPAMAADALPQLTTREKDLLENVQQAFRKGIELNEAQRRLDLATSKRLARWLIELQENARRVSFWFVRSTARGVTASQRRALIDAGISEAALKQKWRVPVVGTHLGESAAAKLPQIIDDMTGLITRMAADDLERLRGVIAEGIHNGQTISALRQTLSASQGFTMARAKRVALDQSNKVNEAITLENDKDLGIEEGIWVHVPGQYTSRQSHIDMNGKRFKIAEGCFDAFEGRKVHPSELHFCRCIYRPILPPELLE